MQLPQRLPQPTPCSLNHFHNNTSLSNVIFGFAQYVFQSLQIATLSLMADRLRRDDARGAEAILCHALFIALAAGALTTLLLELFATQMVLATGVRDMALVPYSVLYLRLRALAQPAVLGVMVCQSGLLVQRDSVTPMLTVLLMSAVSGLLNVIFVAGMGAGVAGAALTTVATQYVGLAALLVAINRKKGGAAIRAAPRVPRLLDLKELLSTMGPLSLQYVAKNACYLLIQATAAGLGTVKLAAHQAVFSFWCAFVLGGCPRLPWWSCFYHPANHTTATATATITAPTIINE